MRAEPGIIADDERELLQEASAWTGAPAHVELTQSQLAQIAAEKGLNFATALLYQRLRASRRHGPFIERIEALMNRPRNEAERMEVLVAVAPGAFYREMPGSGADGRLLRRRVAAYGCRTAVIPTNGVGTAQENGRIIRDWVREHSGEKILLASLSKGGGDVKAALALPDAAEAFRPVVGWLNLSGITQGSPLINALRKSRWASLFYKTLCWWKKIDFAMTRQLEWGPGTALDFPLVLPPQVRLINVVGFPLERHMTSRILLRWRARIADKGPNDGLILLADACALPGLIYPVWGADHNLRPAWDIRRLAGALAVYLAETLSLWAPTENASCATRC